MKTRAAIAWSTVRSFDVVVFSPFLDQDFSFAHAVEDFTVQKRIPEPGIEAFALSILPR